MSACKMKTGDGREGTSTREASRRGREKEGTFMYGFDGRHERMCNEREAGRERETENVCMQELDTRACVCLLPTG